MSPTLDLEKLVLKQGAHKKRSKEMCIMEAVAYVANEPWSDHPQCASPVISAFLRSYNDSVSDRTNDQLQVTQGETSSCPTPAKPTAASC